VTSVLIVDDDALVRAGLSLILGGADDIVVAAEASDGREAVDLAREHRPDVVLMDIRMPQMNGLEYVVRALAAGASGFLLKDTPPAEIVDAVRKVADGDPMLSPSVTAQLIRQVAAGASSDRAALARRRLAALTDREMEVAVAVGRGLSNAEVSKHLHMSVPTVKAHISRLFTKLDVHNRVQIAICVHDAGLV
jgi:DNA-binding NarL/FixJ family response regulator